MRAVCSAAAFCRVHSCYVASELLHLEFDGLLASHTGAADEVNDGEVSNIYVSLEGEVVASFRWAASGENTEASVDVFF